MINAELVVRSRNVQSKNVIKRHTPTEFQPNLIIDFLCECSDLTCDERVPLTLEQYEKHHDQATHFVIVKGHEEPKVEKVHKHADGIAVVEKYAL